MFAINRAALHGVEQVVLGMAHRGRLNVLANILGKSPRSIFREFDDRYTAPIHGFRDAEDYWARCSARFFLEAIRCPALLLSAADDPFLAPECYPLKVAEAHEWLHLEMPAHGGHVGFVGSGLEPEEYYSERCAVRFLVPGT